jgi:hypothetical protein
MIRIREMTYVPDVHEPWKLTLPYQKAGNEINTDATASTPCRLTMRSAVRYRIDGQLLSKRESPIRD